MTYQGMELKYSEQSWNMCLEGNSRWEPEERHIVGHAKSMGYKLTELEVWEDHRGEWRFSAELIKY